MPLYDYACPFCGHKFERLHLKVDDLPEECPRCERPADKVDSVPAPFKWNCPVWNK